jgi:hypothetical protein
MSSDFALGGAYLTSIELGPLALHVGLAEAAFAHVGTPAAQPDIGVVEGEAIGALVTASGVNIDLALVRWPGGGRELKTLDTHSSPPPLNFLSARTTLVRDVVDGRELSLMFLEAVAPQRANPSRMSAQQVTVEHLDWILGASVEVLLRGHGAVAFGSGAELRGDESKARNCLLVAFDHDNIVVPLVAFAITRQLSLLRGFDKAKWGT